jgi:CBS domain-containing protein
MRDSSIGDVIVLDGDRIRGIVTDRDLVVRAIARERDPQSTQLEDVCSRELTTVSPDDLIDRAIRLMRDKAIRRLPVVAAGRPVGILSIGDLAIERDRESALAAISGAPPNQ